MDTIKYKIIELLLEKNKALTFREIVNELKDHKEGSISSTLYNLYKSGIIDRYKGFGDNRFGYHYKIKNISSFLIDKK